MMFLALSVRSHVRLLLTAVCAFLIAPTIASATATEAKRRSKTLVMGIVPQQAPAHLAELWGPLLEKLSEQTGYTLQFATAKDIPSFETCLAEGQYDLAYMNPYHYTVYHESSGYRAFAKAKDARLRGILVAKIDSDYSDVTLLNGKRLAFPSPAALAASVLPRSELKERGIAVEPVYVKSHDSVYRSVASGLLPAGGGIMRTFETLPADTKNQLKVIFETKTYTPHAFAAAPHVSQDTVSILRDRMQGFDNKEALSPLGMSGFETASSKDWDDIRTLNLTQEGTGLVPLKTSGSEPKNNIVCRFD